MLFAYLSQMPPVAEAPPQNSPSKMSVGFGAWPGRSACLGLVCPVCLSFPCCRTLPSRCSGTWPVRGPAFRRCSDAFARDNCLPVQCRFAASLAGMFSATRGIFLRVVGCPRIGKCCSFFSFSLFGWQTRPPLAEVRLFLSCSHGGSLFGINFRERTFTFGCLLWP